MAPTLKTRQINVLITGFGPFMSVEENPSWLAVKDLHDTYLDLYSPPSASSSSRATGEGTKGVKARIQTLQVPVHYGSVLDLVPRIHGNLPVSAEAKFWHDSRLDPRFGGKQDAHYPEAYPVQHPSTSEAAAGGGEGWDVVIHVGVGRGGSIRCETQAHKLGYGKPDANQCFAPLLSSSSSNPTPAQLKSVDPKYLDNHGQLRGFGEGYESFSDIESSPLSVSSLVAWLKQQQQQQQGEGKGSVAGEGGLKEEQVEQSFNPGRYLCDFIYYCSLCEAKRKHAKAQESGQEQECGSDSGRTSVLFVHVPPAQDISPEKCRRAIQSIAWYMAREKATVTL